MEDVKWWNLSWMKDILVRQIGTKKWGLRWRKDRSTERKMSHQNMKERHRGIEIWWKSKSESVMKGETVRWIVYGWMGSVRQAPSTISKTENSRIFHWHSCTGWDFSWYNRKMSSWASTTHNKERTGTYVTWVGTRHVSELNVRPLVAVWTCEERNEHPAGGQEDIDRICRVYKGIKVNIPP